MGHPGKDLYFGEGELPKQSVNSLKPKAVENLLRKATESLKGNSRRTFMAQSIEAYGPGGQNWAEENLGHGCQTYTFDKSKPETILLTCFFGSLSTV